MPRLSIDDLSSELEKLDEQDGITPEAVVEVASDPNNILHAHFEWDDAKAGHAQKALPLKSRRITTRYCVWSMAATLQSWTRASCRTR